MTNVFIRKISFVLFSLNFYFCSGQPFYVSKKDTSYTSNCELFKENWSYNTLWTSNAVGRVSCTTGQPDCDYFMKTGDCKYRSACRYNHPVSRDSKLRLPLLSSKGLYSKSVCLLYWFFLHCLNWLLWLPLLIFLPLCFA